MHLWTNPAKPRQREEQQKVLQVTSGRAWGHIKPVGSTGKGSWAALWCWATPRATLYSPHLGSRTSHHTPLFCIYCNFPGSTSLKTTLQPTPAHQQALCRTHLQLTSDCPDLSDQALNCEAAAAAPATVWPGNTLAVTAITLTPSPASHIQTKPGQTFYIHQQEGESKTLTGLNNLSASLTDADIFDTH